MRLRDVGRFACRAPVLFMKKERLEVIRPLKARSKCVS